MAKTFTASLRGWKAKTEEAMRNVMRASVQDVCEDMQTPVAQGGRMPVDTSYLRNSLASGLNGSFGPESPDSYVLTIAEMDLGDVARFGYGADYALFQEAGTSKMVGRHFMGSAAAKWPQIVEANAARYKP